MFDFLQFDRALRSGWDERMQDGHFRFSLDGVKTRIVPGRFGFVTTVHSYVFCPSIGNMQYYLANVESFRGIT